MTYDVFAERDAQVKWIEEHGGDLAGYIDRYGEPGVTEKHYGNGGFAIWTADAAQLNLLESRCNEIMENKMNMPRVYRVSFDFRDKDAAIEFFGVFKEGTKEDLGLVEKDDLHDRGKNVTEYLVRSSNSGNGRPVI